MERKQRRRFSREFKVEAVRLACQEGGQVSQVARDLGVGENLLRRRRATVCRTSRPSSMRGAAHTTRNDQRKGWERSTVTVGLQTDPLLKAGDVTSPRRWEPLDGRR